MSSANVKAVSALEEMQTALLHFKSDTLSSLNAMQTEVRRTLDWLKERRYHWQRELSQRMQALIKAEKALNDCIRINERARAEGRGVDCSGLAATVRTLRMQVKEAERELQNVEQHMKRVEDVNERFQREARQLTNVLNADLAKGVELLRRSTAILSGYTASSAGASSGGGGIASGNGMSNIPPGLSAVSPGEKDSFSITDWSGYPSGLSEPKGPFRLLPDDEYQIARQQGNAATKAYRDSHPLESQGKQIHHIHPVKFGGDPTDEANLVPLTRSEHALYTTWWSRIQREIESPGGIS